MCCALCPTNHQETALQSLLLQHRQGCAQRSIGGTAQGSQLLGWAAEEHSGATPVQKELHKIRPWRVTENPPLLCTFVTVHDVTDALCYSWAPSSEVAQHWEEGSRCAWEQSNYPRRGRSGKSPLPKAGGAARSEGGAELWGEKAKNPGEVDHAQPCRPSTALPCVLPHCCPYGGQEGKGKNWNVR